MWRVLDNVIDYFILREGRYDQVAPDAEGIMRSHVFPGLWLDREAMLGRDMRRVLDVLQRGLSTSEHHAFVARLADAARTGQK